MAGKIALHYIPITLLVVFVLFLLIKMKVNGVDSRFTGKAWKTSELSVEEQYFLRYMMSDVDCKKEYGMNYFFYEHIQGCESCDLVCDTNFKRRENATICATQCKEYELFRQMKEIIQQRPTEQVIPIDITNMEDGNLAEKLKQLEENSRKYKDLDEIKERDLNEHINLLSDRMEKEKQRWQKQMKRLDNDYGAMIEELQDAVGRIENHEKIYFITLVVASASLVTVIVFYLVCNTLFRSTGGKTKMI